MNLSQKLKEYRYIKTSEEAIEAVKQDSDALRYVANQTEEICLEAVKQNGYALQYVKINIKEDPIRIKISEIKEKFGCSEIEIIEG